MTRPLARHRDLLRTRLRGASCELKGAPICSENRTEGAYPLALDEAGEPLALRALDSTTLQARTRGAKGIASRIALTLADSPFPAEASNIASLPTPSLLPSSNPRGPWLLAQALVLFRGPRPILIHLGVSTLPSSPRGTLKISLLVARCVLDLR